MDLTIVFDNGAEFVWRKIKASEVESVAVDIKDLAKKAEEKEARKSGHSRRLQPRSRPTGRSKG
jgi:hypothetical protein